MESVVDLLDRHVYGMSQVDRVLGLPGGTAHRWIDGYDRGGRHYPPVVRLETTGSELVTWGEFVEARLLAEYRNAGSPIQRLRAAVEALRGTIHPLYPLAHARPFLDVAGRELVMRVQDDVKLERDLRLVVVRNNQIVLAERAEQFVDSVEYDDEVVRRIRPVAGIREVVMDPLRQFGEPVVRSVRTEVIAELVRAGETVDGIAETYELTRAQVEAAIRFELHRAPAVEAA